MPPAWAAPDAMSEALRTPAAANFETFITVTIVQNNLVKPTRVSGTVQQDG